MADVMTEEAGTVLAKRLEEGPQARDSELEWSILLTTRPNILIAGPAGAVEQSLALLMPHLAPPVCYWTSDTLLPTPGDVKTLVIQNVDALFAEQQRALLSWLAQTAVPRTRVVSTTTVPLFQRVAAGLFLDVLYYRLNTVLLDGTDARVTDGDDYPRPQSQHRHRTDTDESANV